MVELFEKMGVPGAVISVIAFVLLVAGAIKEFTNSFNTFKKVFNWIKGIKKRIKEKKEAREKMQQSLLDAQKIIKDFGVHYSEDNISQRNNWMNWVNNQAEDYNKTLASIDNTLSSFKEKLEGFDVKLEKTTNLAEETSLNQKRLSVLEFAARVNNPRYDYSKEYFLKMKKIIEEYETYIEENNISNGEIDQAIKVIEQAYKEKEELNAGKLFW